MEQATGQSAGSGCVGRIEGTALSCALDTMPQDDEDGVMTVSKATLERLLVVLTKSYGRHPLREVKQVTDTLRHLLGHAR
ncbi:MAG: hypothetical protein M3R24_24680 [Chloroflexota bacterium]|nr:hypothetical protein [Chloroflexota bacterium]